MATKVFAPCVNTTVRCIEACERCAAECGTSGNAEREKCAAVARDCADIASLSLNLMSRGSRYADAICAAHAEACKACAEICAKFPHACCLECMNACVACARECGAYHRG
jgi:hypothetical protein